MTQDRAGTTHSGANVTGWGTPGFALLPIGLRRLLASEVLPSWVCEDLALAPESTAGVLDASIWQRIEGVPERVRRYVLNLAAYRIRELERECVASSDWPESLEPAAVQWPTRLGNALGRYLFERSSFGTLTYGDLLRLPNIGVKSTLDFAVIIEAISSAHPSPLAEAAVDELRYAANEDWTARLNAEDPRLRDVTPVYRGYLGNLLDDALNNPEGAMARALSGSMPAIRERAAALADDPLDIALENVLRAVATSDRQVEMVKARIGWNAAGPLTLQEVGDRFDLTRERVRQVVDKVLARLSPTYVPQLEQAIGVLEAAAPIKFEDAAELLVERQIATRPIDPRGLRAAAELLGYDVTFHFDSADGSEWVIPLTQAGTGHVFASARRAAGRVGVSNVDEVVADLAANDPDTSEGETARLLRGSSRLEFLIGEWFWIPGASPDRNRLRNVSQKMLAVTTRLSVATMRAGVRRSYKFRGVETVPPADVLLAFYGAHPEFNLVDGDQVESSVPLDYKVVLGDIEESFVDVLRSTETGLMDRAQLEEAMTKRGLNVNSISVFTTYSPVLDHPASNVWCLRGAAVDPSELEALRSAVATRSRVRRTIAYGWDSKGRLRLSTVLANVSAPVVGIPRAISRYVMDGSFTAVAQDGTSSGTIVVGENGTSWGYSPFLRRRGAEPGDILTIAFDLTTLEAHLTLGDTALIDDDELAD